ncbi:hypothetical protein OUZ56_012293 [Daphnia magna]|uniref:Uncharacterized protein n=1 Tax=Daphnia magna TaxID=35525 RepID=A0ABQ9Z2K1_9CRUS|nr:hypothetical protein OUZ56_012293 [Daphnia magna]
MQAFSSVAIFCDRQRSGRFDDLAAHLKATLDLGNFEEARRQRLMHSKLYGDAAEEFDNFKLENPIRAQEFKEGLQHDLKTCLKHNQFNSFEMLIDKAEFTAMAFDENQTRVHIHAAFSSPNIPSNQNELASVLEALKKLNSKIDQTAST